MPTRLLIAPPATGKTHACLTRLLEVAQDQPLAPVWYVVPNHLLVVATRRRLADMGGALGVNLGTFHQLYSEILERAGNPVPVIAQPVMNRLVRAAVTQVQAQGQLAYYGEISDKPGFIQTLQERFAELKRALVWPEDFLREAEARGEPGPVELARVYQAYQLRLQELNWADPEGLSWLAVEALEKKPDLLAHCPLLVVDGFDSFVPSQTRILELLAASIPEILITLPGRPTGTLASVPAMPRQAHRRFQGGMRVLQTALKPTIETLTNEPRLPRQLAHLEANLFETGAGKTHGGVTLVLAEARDPLQEAREALRWLKARVVRERVPISGCAVIVPQAEPYQAALAEASAEFGLPLRLTTGQPLAQTAALAALLDMLNLTVRNYPRRPLLDSLRSPYFSWEFVGLQSQDAATLELVSAAGQIIEGLGQWEETLDTLSRHKAARLPYDLDEDLAPPSLPTGESAAALLAGLRALAARLTPPSAQGLADWVLWLEDLLEELHYFENGLTAQDTAALVRLRDVLRGLVLSKRIAGEQELDYATFVGDLEGIIQTEIYNEPSRWKEAAITVTSLSEVRGARFQAVGVMGLSEGIMPEGERADPFLDEELRGDQGLEPRLGREQGGLFYQALTRADGQLLLTRPYLADGGEKWEASPYWDAVANLVADDPKHVRPDEPRALNEAASPEEVLLWAVRRAKSLGRGLPRTYHNHLRGRWERLQHGRDVLAARLETEVRGPYEGYPDRAAEPLAAQFGPEHIWSPSRLESYGQCPFRFYAAHILKLEPKELPELGLDAAQLGTLLHSILEKAYLAAEDPADPDSVLDVLPGVAQECFERAPQEYGFRPTVAWQVEQAQLMDKLAAAVRAIPELEPGWRPHAHEQLFGLEGHPPAVVDTEAGPIQVRGVIDRVDRNEAGEVRVLDYKTGGSHLSKKDLLDGYRLQLPLYALAAQEALGLGQVVEGLYWALLAEKAGSLKLRSFSDESWGEGLEGAMRVMQAQVTRIVKGVRAGEFPPQPPRGGCPAYCPARAWCWRYEPGRY